MKKNTLKTCSVSQCSKIAVSVGMCKTHYRQYYAEKNRKNIFEYNQKYYKKIRNVYLNIVKNTA